MPSNIIPAACLPDAAVPVTVVWVHPEYDDTVECVIVARDWQHRGEDYIRKIVGLDGPTRIVAIFDGHHVSLIGSTASEA